MYEQTLALIAKKLSATQAVWAVGASTLLWLLHFIKQPEMLLFTVNIEELETCDYVMSQIGHKIKPKPIPNVSMKYFHDYEVNSVHVQLVSDLRITHSDGIYRYIFDNQSVVGSKSVRCAKVHMASLEEWYVIYGMIAEDAEKAELIDDYFLKHRVRNPALFERALQCELPADMAKRIKMFLSR